MVDILLSQESSQSDWGHSRRILHGPILQNYVYPNPRSPCKDVGRETVASNFILNRSTDNPRPNYARVCLATPSKTHMDTSINADESELFGTPSDIDSSPKVKASTESLIPAELERNPRSASHVKGRYIVPKAPKKV